MYYQINALKLNFNKKNLYIKESDKGYGLSYFSKKKFKKGDVIIKTFGKIIPQQTKKYSMQIDIAKHFLPQKWSGKFLNHSCDSNCFPRTNNDIFPEIVALTTIEQDTEITFSYWMSEFKWTKIADENNIKCGCLSKNCTKKIPSFSDLSIEKQINNKHFLLPYLKKIL